MDFEMSGAGYVARCAGDPAGVLARVFDHAVLDGEGEVVLLGLDLDPVGQLVLEGLVVLEPGRGEALETGVGGATEEGILPS